VLAAISLSALLLVILLSCVTRLNVGFVAIAFAWLVGLLAGMDANQVIAGFPSSLFLTLVGVTLLFTQAEVNGTLERVAAAVTRLANGNAGWVVVLFFLLSMVLSAVGAGAIATAALAAPLAMGAASRAGISPFLMAIIVGNGANAGNLSPLSPIGVIVDKTIEKVGLGDAQWRIFWNHLIAHLLITAVVIVVLGGWSLWKKRAETLQENPLVWERHHGLTLGVVFALVAGVLLLKVPVGLGAFAAATVLTVLRAAPEATVVAKMPWGVMLMVTGMSVLIAMLERTGGLDLFTAMIARLSTLETVNGVVAFVSGLVSAYSSTSGVVLPAFLPMAPKLVAQLGGGDVIAIISSINLGSHLVDVSPLSTIGAMCIAAAGADVDKQKLFRELMLWGLAMSVVGGLASYLFFGGWLL
jgi:Na+/H+ antiporter NhaD/arsenite permease-like protein